MFEKLCGGIVASSFPDPHNQSECIFILFDTVHLLKSMRNNWINQKYPAKTFVLPSPLDFNIAENASLSPLKDLYLHELTSYVILAPRLS